MMHRLKIMLAALAMLLAPAAMAQTKLQVPPGPWTPPQIAVTFPETIGEYKRVAITEFDSQNHGVGYVLERNGVRLNTITIFIYSFANQPTCQEEFDASTASILRSKPSATRIVLDAAASPRGKAGAALHSRYAYTGDYADMVGIPIRSDLYLYCKPGSGWMIKARTSWPASVDMSGETAKILAAVTWPRNVAD